MTSFLSTLFFLAWTFPKMQQISDCFVSVGWHSSCCAVQSSGSCTKLFLMPFFSWGVVRLFWGYFFHLRAFARLPTCLPRSPVYCTSPLTRRMLSAQLYRSIVRFLRLLLCYYCIVLRTDSTHKSATKWRKTNTLLLSVLCVPTTGALCLCVVILSAMSCLDALRGHLLSFCGD